ncbi:cytochrome c3 family protein [Desulfovibrio aminophilus]|uniref:cytochrome c3 family protein n=1 Tax=Desulfovibrio aminophilus TaxID=81425 RepID=UPI003394F4A6
MRRTLPILFAVLALFLLRSAEAQAPPDDAIGVAVPQGAATRMPRVLFPHAAHADRDCTTCHHKWDMASEQRKCSSQGCHDLANPANTKEKADWRYFRNAFHGRQFSCNACHWALRKAKKPTGPTECKQCHIP